MPINTTPFYHQHTRNLITVFGTLFNNMKVVRDDGKVITVPIQYGSKEKWYLMKKDNPEKINPEAIILPRMGFVQSSLTYDSTRKLNSSKRYYSASETSNSVHSVHQPVPYNVSIELYLWSKTLTDGLQIVEQIIPYFRPSFTVTMIELSDPEIERDVLITLNEVSHEDNAEGLFDTTRMLEWSFSFNIESNFYGPISDIGVIKTVYVNTFITDTDQVVKLTGTPDPEDATQEDEWTFNEVWEYWPDIT